MTDEQYERAVQADKHDRERGREMDAAEADAALYEIRAALEAARRGEIGDGRLEDAASELARQVEQHADRLESEENDR